MLDVWLIPSCSSTEFCWVKDDRKHIEDAHGSRPEDPSHAILDYKMEQLADLLWIGGVIAKQGSSTFQKAWGFRLKHPDISSVVPFRTFHMHAHTVLQGTD
jgi:hypothetical protein